jgi:ribosome biogenesis protein NSA1
VRLYDSTAQSSRPVYSVEPAEHAIRCVCVTPDGASVIAGDVAGGLYRLDLKSGKRTAKFRGLAGACRGVYCHPTLDLVAACGLDRHVRVFSIATQSCRRAVYVTHATLLSNLLERVSV